MSAAETTVAVVTGASRGLGFHVARGLASRGTKVWAIARTMGGLEELDDLIAAEGGTRPTLLPLDISDDGAVDRLGAAIHERHGRLDQLVHCAIHAPPLSPVAHVATKDIDKAFAINARAVQRLIRSLEPLLLQSPAATAVFLTDPRDGQPFWSDYHASKDAGLAFARAWAAEREKSALSVLFHRPPAMPTATRARFFPSENRDALTACRDAAQGVLALLEVPQK